jgi:hypothetical protein
MELGGLDSIADQNFFWFKQALLPGDEVTTRVLSAGEYELAKPNA